MPQHERKRVVIIPCPIRDREELLQRLEAVGKNIHSPWAWYREDIRRLLAIVDMQHTELMELKHEMEE